MTMFKYEIGQEVWYTNKRGKAAVAEVGGRKSEEMTKGNVSRDYFLKGIGMKDEDQLYKSAPDLVADLLSEAKGVDYMVHEQDRERVERYNKLYVLCRRFIVEAGIDSEEAIGRASDNSWGLVKRICDLIGYYDGGRGEEKG